MAKHVQEYERNTKGGMDCIYDGSLWYVVVVPNAHGITQPYSLASACLGTLCPTVSALPVHNIAR